MSKNELIDAAGSGDLGAVLRLLRGGESPNVKLRDGLTPLMAAANSGHADVVKSLLDHGAATNEVDDHGMSALMMAFSRRRPKVVELLLEHEDDIDRTFPASIGPFIGWTALMHAAKSGDVDSLQQLLRKSPDLNLRDANGETALMKAADSGNREIVDLLLKAGADALSRIRRASLPSITRREWDR